MSITKLTNSGLSGDKYPNLMADNTFMEPIATTLVGSGGASTVTFSNIPQGYKHLQIRGIGRTTTATTDANANIRFNGDSGTNYNSHYLAGSGTSAIAGGGTASSFVFVIRITGASSAANIFGAGVVDILDYTNQNKYKTIRCLTGQDQNGVATGYMFLESGLWMNTSAITSITLYPDSNNFAQYSRFSLYGIRG